MAMVAGQQGGQQGHELLLNPGEWSAQAWEAEYLHHSLIHLHNPLQALVQGQAWFEVASQQ